MLKMRPYAPPDRIAIRDSIDEEISDDIEDDVFIRDGRSAKLNEEYGLKRPLMAPRRSKNCKNLSGHHHHNNNQHHHRHQIPIMKRHNNRRCWKCCEPFCYGLAAITILIVLIFVAAIILTLFPFPIQKIKSWLKPDSKFYTKYHSNGQFYDSIGGNLNIDDMFNGELVPCTELSVQRIWSKVFPRMNSESPIRKTDLNNDNIDDIIFGYGVDDSIQYEDVVLPKCTSARFENEVPCEGGVIALNGANGELIWQRWAVANVFSLFCNMDIDKDGYPDCVAAGRGGLIFAINGRNGNVLWNFREIDIETNSPILIDLYTINIVRDLNDDEIQDILAVHVEERETSRSGHIKLISGKNGRVIRSIPTPYREEVFVPLQIITKPDGTELIMIITGGQNTPGGIYSMRLLSLMEYTSEKEFSPLFQNENSGFMVPAVLTDVNNDSIEDIIISSFNSTIYAFDGHNYKMIWNYTFPASESVSSIVPGHFNNDNVTDFMVKYNTGPGFPVYYYSQTTILNGINGQPLLDLMMTDSGGPNSLLGGVSISQTFGGDFFLHWQMQCRDKSDAKDAYEFIPDSDVILQARADTCILRYNTSTVLKLYAIARHVEPPGAVIFSTDDLGIHLNHTEYRQLTQKNSVSPLKHPKMLKKLLIKEFPGISDNNQRQFHQQQQQQREQIPLYRHSSGSSNIISNILNPDGSNKKHSKDLKMLKENYRKPILIESKLNNNLPESSDVSDRNSYEQMKPYFYMPFNNQPGKEFRDYETSEQKPQDEYESLYNDEQQNDRPIHLRSKYPSSSLLDTNNNNNNNNINNGINNRDVRSDYIDYETNISKNESTNTEKSTETHSIIDNDDDYRTNVKQQQKNTAAAVVVTGVGVGVDKSSSSSTSSTSIADNEKKNISSKHTDHKNKKLSAEPLLDLWDLEVEKENEEAFKDVQQQQQRQQQRTDYGINFDTNNDADDYDHRHKRDDNNNNDNNDDENQNSDNENTDDNGNSNSNNNNNNGMDNYLSSISSTGVLLETLDKNSLSSIDFAFILNVRESEIYPPLFLPQDLNCIEDKMSAYRSYTNDNLLSLEKQFLKQCLKARINNIAPNVPRYESQIIVTRISIMCTCNNLQSGEICSKFKNIKEQKWTEFMGNDGNGLYK